VTESNLPLQFLLLVFGGWLNRRQQLVVEYLLEQNRILRDQLGDRRLRLTDDQRRRLALRDKLLGRRVLATVAGIVTPDTILRWYRRLIARKYDGAGNRCRRRGRPPTAAEIAKLVVRLASENPGYVKLSVMWSRFDPRSWAGGALLRVSHKFLEDRGPLLPSTSRR
jgi:hypothetical protein